MKYLRNLLLMVLAMLGLFAGIASAATFAAPAGSEITWQDDGKGNAVVSVKAMNIDKAEHYLGEGQGWGRVIPVRVPAAVPPNDVQQFILPNYRKNGLRFNVMRADKWAFLRCGGQEGHFPSLSPRLENGLMVACDYFGGVTPDGRPIYWGAIEHPQFTRRAGDAKGDE